MAEFCPILTAAADGKEVPCKENCAWWAGKDKLGNDVCAVYASALQTRCLDEQFNSVVKALKEK